MLGQRIDAVERNLRVNIEPIVYNEIKLILMDFNGSTPQKYALKVLAGLHGAELKNYILTDELQRRSVKTPISVEEKSKLMQEIQRKFQLSALNVRVKNLYSNFVALNTPQSVAPLFFLSLSFDKKLLKIHPRVSKVEAFIYSSRKFLMRETKAT